MCDVAQLVKVLAVSGDADGRYEEPSFMEATLPCHDCIT